MKDESLPRLLTGDVVGQVDATQIPRYAGLGTFARLPFIDEVSDVDVALVGIPFDTGVSYRPGARFGPSHVRESSRLLRPFNPAGSKSPFASQQVAESLTADGQKAAGQPDRKPLAFGKNPMTILEDRGTF